MIEQTTNKIFNNQFLQFNSKKTVQQPVLKNQNEQPIAIVSLNNEKEEGHKLFTKTVALVAITGSIIGLFLTKGISQKKFKKLTPFMRKLDDKIYDYTQKYNSLSFIQKWCLKVNKGIQKALNAIKIGNNIAAVKDSMFALLCKKLHITKPAKWITSQFKKVTKLSAKKAYQNARNITDENIAKLRELIPKLQDEQTAIKLTQYIEKLEKEIATITNATNRNIRLQEIEKTTEPIGNKVLPEILEIFRKPTQENLKKLTLYRTEINAAEGKEKVFKNLFQSKRLFSFNIQDKTNIMANARDEISYILKPEDKTSRNVLRKISKQIAEYKNLSGENEYTLRRTLVENIRKNIDELKHTIKSNKYNTEDEKLLANKINEIIEILDKTDEKGTIEDILSLIKQSLKEKNPQDYIKTKNLTNEIRQAVSKAVESEIKLYDKFAEYSVGSAPTDILGLFFPTGLAAYAVSQGKDKDEKISATLKAGIPISGGVMTTFYATTKMMTGVQGLMLGTLTGLFLNALGSKIDEKYKEYTDKKKYIQKAVYAYKKNNSQSA